MYLKSQDILVLLKLAVWGEMPWLQAELAAELGLAQSQVSASLKRAEQCGLYETDERKVNRASLVEVLVHAVRFLEPARLGARAHGLPTAWGHREAFAAMTYGASESPVWPVKGGKFVKGAIDGVAVNPIHEKAPLAASKDPRLHELLAAVDAMRVGRARDMEIARDLIRRRLLPII